MPDETEAPVFAPLTADARHQSYDYSHQSSRLNSYSPAKLTSDQPGSRTDRRRTPTRPCPGPANALSAQRIATQTEKSTSRNMSEDNGLDLEVVATLLPVRLEPEQACLSTHTLRSARARGSEGNYQQQRAHVRLAPEPEVLVS